MAGLALGLGGDIGMGLLAGGNRPSYFEMFAQELIVTSLRPAMQFVTAVLAPTFPFLFRTQKWQDEIFTALLGVMEWAYLRSSDAGFAESFFGLKRVRYFPPSVSEGKAPPSTWLRPIDQLGSLACMVLGPYLKWKLDAWVSRQAGTGAAAELGLGALGAESSSEEEDEQAGVAAQLARRGRGVGRGGLLPRMKRLFLKLWPYINAVYEGTYFVYQFLYLVERTVGARCLCPCAPNSRGTEVVVLAL